MTIMVQLLTRLWVVITMMWLLQKENDEILNAAGVNDVSTLQKLSSKGVDVTAACNWVST